ncbi:hypothetical protein ABW19_dt0208152 [Dactylella cylindrospora]|nr:hypothetical protein ABW19_dt0208152 [Dactylella cylindrospora]
MPLSPIHRPTSPTATSFDTRRDSLSAETVATSIETGSVYTASVPVPVPQRGDPVPEETSEEQQPSAECKEAIERIKVAIEEKESLERRLQELEKLISGKTAQRAHVRSLSVRRVQGQQHISILQPQVGHVTPSVESTEQATPAPTTQDDADIIHNDTEAPPTPTQEVRSIMTRGTSFEDDTDSPDSSRQPTPTPQISQPQRQRPRLPQLQTTLPLPSPPASEERPTPSSAARITSAVSRIANWIFGGEEESHPQSPAYIASPQYQLRPQHASYPVQQYQFIQAHHLQLTPTTPQHHHRTAHLSAPSAITPTPIVGYQQRWRPRNVEDVDPVPPYCEQDPNPSPGFVFFPQTSLLTPLPTPTSPTGISIATQMYGQAM